MSFLASLKMTWSKRPPIGVISLCLAYAALALRALIGLIPSIGGPSFSQHGVVHVHHIVAEVVLALLFLVITLASLTTVTGNRTARFWLSFSLAVIIPIAIIIGTYDSFHEYQYISPGTVSISWVMTAVWSQLNFIRDILIAVPFVLIAHYWLLYRNRLAKNYFLNRSDA